MNPATTGEIWPIDRPILWEDNPRKISKKDFERLKTQIQKHGVYKPIIVDQQGIIVGGNMRYQALQALGVETVWVSVVQINSEAERLEIALSDNDRAGEYDEEKLAEMVSLYDIDQELYTIDTGKMLTIKDLSNKFGPDPKEDDPRPPTPEAPISQPGEIYQLGRHRLMCGDATSYEAVQQLVGEHKVDLFFTDPPYNIDYDNQKFGPNKSSQTVHEAITQDNQTPEAFYQFLVDSFTNARQVCKTGSTAYICHPDLGGLIFRQAFQAAGWTLKQCLIWLKQNMVLSRQDYHWKHEPILYGWLEGAPHYFVDDRTQTTIWEFDRPSSSKEHPTMKPVKLCGQAINNSSKPGDIVLDLFGGSGSTLIAAEQTGRTCFMMEIDPKYCDVIRNRYQLLVQPEEV